MSQEIAYLYKITDATNGREYIGVSKDPNKRFRKHCDKPTDNRRSILANAIQAHGKDKFSMQILCKSTAEYCYEMEAKLIEGYKTRTPSGYNITAGGLGYTGFRGPAHHKYGKRNSPELNEHMRQLFLGRPIPEEQKAKISATLTGRKAKPETLAKMSATRKGCKQSEQHVQARTGWKMPEEAKEKIRQSRLGKRNYVATPDENKAQSDRLKAKWADPEFRAMMMEARSNKKEVTS